MSALTEFLFPAPARRTVGSIVGWWESRRLKYNAIVGGAGVVSVGIATVIGHLPPNPLPGVGVLPPWQGIVIFGALANVCYFLGPTVEVVVDELWGRQVLPVGPSLFRMGLTFSVGLALLPALIFLLQWVLRIVLAVV